MFGLFKRTKIDVWEVELLKTLLGSLPDCKNFLLQIESGLLKGVLINRSDIPNYVGFTYNSSVYNDFYASKGENFKLSNLKVMDILSGDYVQISLYFAYGVVNGYSVDGLHSAKYKLDTTKVNVASVKKIKIGEDVKDVLSLLTSEELMIINEGDIYMSNLNGKIYYHLKELKDGDFLGIDLDNHIYTIKHDPFEICQVERTELMKFFK